MNWLEDSKRIPLFKKICDPNVVRGGLRKVFFPEVTYLMLVSERPAENPAGRTKFRFTLLRLEAVANSNIHAVVGVNLPASRRFDVKIGMNIGRPIDVGANSKFIPRSAKIVRQMTALSVLGE